MAAAWSRFGCAPLPKAALRVPKAKVRLLSGATSRMKQIAIDGDPAKLGEALRVLISKD